jgi:hypothetical protein
MRQLVRMTLVLVTASVLVVFSAEHVRKTGQMRIGSYCAVDLDEGDWECMVVVDGDGTESPGYPSKKTDDLRVEDGDSRLYLRAVHGAELAIGTRTEAGMPGCMTATYAKGRLRVDCLPAGLHICVRTNQARYAELRIDEPVRGKAGYIVLSYTTWER